LGIHVIHIYGESTLACANLLGYTRSSPVNDGDELSLLRTQPQMHAVNSDLSTLRLLTEAHRQNTGIESQAVIKRRTPECDCGETGMYVTLSAHQYYPTLLTCW